MTPDDLAGLRAQDASAWRHRDIVALMDALEAAWAERAAALDVWRGMGDAWAVERERAERAEANERVLVADGINLAEALMGMEAWADHESDRADRAETLAAELMQDVSTEQAMTDRANAALARVRDLCDDVDETRSTHPFASTVEIRNAIEGP